MYRCANGQREGCIEEMINYAGKGRIATRIRYKKSYQVTINVRLKLSETIQFASLYE